jgi:hypothetical protein
MTSGGHTERLPTIVYIAGLGRGRSGSTLLAELIGMRDDVVAVGELRSVWDTAHQDLTCSCGAQFSACPFWQNVGRSAGHGWAKGNVQRMLSLDRRFCRHRSLPRTLLSRFTRSRSRDRREYEDGLATLYTAVATCSARDVIIDSTKDPGYGAIAGGLSGFDVRVVHLVRDPRGVAMSLRKVVSRPETARDNGAPRDMPRSTVLRSGLEWSIDNLLVETGIIANGDRLLVRYEDVATDPWREVNRIRKFVGIPDLSNLNDGPAGSLVNFGTAHTVGGNPMRFNRNRIVVELDNQWRGGGLPVIARAATTLLTLPLLHRYRYDIRWWS